MRRSPLLPLIGCLGRPAALCLTAAAVASGGLWSCGDTATADEPVYLGPDDGSGEPAALQTLTATIGPDGGELVGEDGSQLEGFRLVVPPGALTEPVALTVEGTIDAVPLPETAESIGPHFTILPGGVEFAVPAELTVPFDPVLRGGWDTPDDECRVWYRDGDGWAGTDAIASSPRGVTVELPRTTVVGAGTFTTRAAIGCAFGCATTTPGPTCLDGDHFCMTQLGTQSVASSFSTYSVSRGVLYWPFVPSSGSVAIAGFDLLNRTAVASTGAASALSGTPTGEITRDDTGALWLGFRHRANVKFEVGRLASLFDAFAVSTEPRAIGVVFDQAARLPVRMRATVVPSRSGQPLSQSITAVRGSQIVQLGLAHGALEIDGAIQIGRALSSPPLQPFLIFGGRWGAHLRSMSTSTTMFGSFTCGDEQVAEIRAVAASPTHPTWAMLCRRTDNRGALLVNGAVRQSFDVGQIPSGRLAVDGDGNAYLADLSRPQITRFGVDGAVTVVPLTTLTDVNDPAYVAMIPHGLGYDNGLDALVVVTRGTGGLRDFWQASNLR